MICLPEITITARVCGSIPCFDTKSKALMPPGFGLYPCFNKKSNTNAARVVVLFPVQPFAVKAKQTA